ITGPNRESLFRQIVTRALPPVVWSNSAIPDDLVSVVHHALAKDPDERYPSMAEFAADLDRYLDGKAVTARPYRYRLDEREIVAERPGSIVVLSFFYFAASIAMLFPVAIAVIMLVILNGPPELLEGFEKTSGGENFRNAMAQEGVNPS